VKALILLSPLPFGCLGRIWSPLFYLLILIISGMALWGMNQTIHILFEKKIRLLGLLFLGFSLFQLVPLPRFILKIISPHTVSILDQFSLESIDFHSLSIVPAETLTFVLRLLVLVFFFYILLHLNLKKSEIYSIVYIIAFSGFFQVILGLFKNILNNNKFFLFFLEWEQPRKTIMGTIPNPDHFSFYLEMIFPLVLGMVLIKMFVLEPMDSSLRNLLRMVFVKKKLLVLVMVLFFLTVGIAFSRSLSGRIILLLSLFLVGMGFFYFRLKTSISFFPHMRWIVLIITLVSIFLAWQNTTARVNRPDRKGNIRARFWENSQRIFKQFPILGTGLGTFKHISFVHQSDDRAEWLTHSHNEYLETLSDGGIIGAGLFFGMLGLLGFSLFKMWRIRHHLEVKMLGLAVLVSLAGAAFHSLFDYALRIPANGFLFTLILALGIKIVLYKREF